jgi:radical SAM protein with 4Fe4S-binding SPASM domain
MVKSFDGDVYDGDPTKTARWWEGPAEPPRVCVWEITLKCDLGCRHCGSRAGTAREGELSTAEALSTVGQLADLGIREVTLIGGEAYLREDWVEIAAAITAHGMACTMVTGGYGFDSFRVQEALAAGVRRIGVSIDGLAATHDHLRGRVGSFAAAVETARAIAATGRIGLSVNSQINRLSLPELPEVAAMLVTLGVTAWQVQLTVALGRAADRPGLVLQPHDILEVIPLLAKLKRDVLEPGGVQLFLGNNVGYFGPYESVLRYGGAAYAWSGCLAGQAALGLEANGTLKGCPSLPTADYGAGSVRDRTIRDMWENSARIRGLGERTRTDLWGFCATCEHADRCKGGCTWTAHALFGKPGNNPYCHHRAQALADRGLRERVVLVERAPGRPFDHGRFELVEEPVPENPAGSDSLRELAGLLGGASKGVWSKAGMRAATSRARLPDTAGGAS